MTDQHLQVRRLARGSLVALILAGGVLPGCKRQAPAVPWTSGTTVIPGKFGWDAETDSILDPTQAPVTDLWWEMVSPKERYLVPMNGAAAAVVKGKTYDQIDAAFVDRRRLQTGKIDGSDKVGVLDPGAILVFRTANGTFGKLQIVGYRRLHDLSFPQASIYSDAVKSVIAQRENIERGHIEVKWQLYRRQVP